MHTLLVIAKLAIVLSPLAGIAYCLAQLPV